MKTMDAVERAMQLAKTPMAELPPLAREFAVKLCQEVGMCIETYLTAYACYAQCVEGLPCNDELYKVLPNHAAWFAMRGWKKQDEVVPAQASTKIARVQAALRAYEVSILLVTESADLIESLATTLRALVEEVEKSGDFDSQFGIGKSLDAAWAVLEAV